MQRFLLKAFLNPPSSFFHPLFSFIHPLFSFIHPKSSIPALGGISGFTSDFNPQPSFIHPQPSFFHPQFSILNFPSSILHPPSSFIKFCLTLSAILFLNQPLPAQDLFEQAVSETSTESTGGIGIGINGYIRGTFFAGGTDREEGLWLQSGYGESALQLDITSPGRVSAFSEIRFRSGYEYGQDTLQLDVREAYVTMQLGQVDILFGKYINVWGKADGVNPTNNLTPQNYFVRSPEADDYRLGNLLLRVDWALSPALGLEGIWVPRYQPSIYRFDLFDMPGYVHFSPGDYPRGRLDEGSLGLKAKVYLSGIDGSVSWFRGYDPLPGIRLGPFGSDSLVTTVTMMPAAFLQQTLGADFATTLAGFGVRGEAGLRLPEGDFEKEVHIPNPDLHYVLGLDRMVGKFNFLVQYLGRYTLDYEDMLPMTGPVGEDMEELPPLPPILITPFMEHELERFNRAIFYQSARWNHSLSFRPSVQLFYETLELEVFAMYNFSIREVSVFPGLTWIPADGMRVRAGYQHYSGPEDTNFDLIGPVLNGGFLELRYTF